MDGFQKYICITYPYDAYKQALTTGPLGKHGASGSGAEYDAEYNGLPIQVPQNYRPVNEKLA